MYGAPVRAFQHEARCAPTMQVPGGNLNPQPQRVLELIGWSVLIEPIRANDILGVHEVLAKCVSVALEPVERHARDPASLRAQPRDEFGIRPTASQVIGASRCRSGQRGNDDAGPPERIALERPQVDREIVCRPFLAQGGSVRGDLVERITTPAKLAITQFSGHFPTAASGT